MEFWQEVPKQGVICNYGIADHFKTSYLSVDFILPLTEENATGLSLLAGVLSRGCKGFPEMEQISRYLSRYYGASFSINASKSGELEILNFSFTYLDNAFAINRENIQDAMVALLKEMLFYPLVEQGGFRERYVEQEKVNLADKINGLLNDKRIYSLERCKALMCEGEAYGISDMGSKEMIGQFDRVRLYTFYQRILKEAYVVISYVGKKKERFLLELAEAFQERTGPMPETAVLEKKTERREFVDEMDLSQSKLNLGYRLGPVARKNGAACRLFNVLYGGSASSKLFMNVRERLSLCYYCASNVDRLKNVLFVSSGVEAAKYAEARNEIEAQLQNIAEGSFTAEEMLNAKAYLIDSIRGFSDSESTLASLMLAGTLRREMKTPEQEMSEIRAVSREDLMAIAREAALDTVYFLKGVQKEA